MNREERRALARKIVKLEKQGEEDSKEIEQLIQDCSIEDLLRLDEYIMKKLLS